MSTAAVVAVIVLAFVISGCASQRPAVPVQTGQFAVDLQPRRGLRAMTT